MKAKICWASGNYRCQQYKVSTGCVKVQCPCPVSIYTESILFCQWKNILHQEKINISRNGCRRSSSIFKLKYRLLLLTVSFTIGSHCKGLELVRPRYTFFLLAGALLLDKKIRQSAAQVVSFCENSNRPLNIKMYLRILYPCFRDQFVEIEVGLR